MVSWLRFIAVIAFALSTFATPPVSASAAQCSFTLGFKTLHDLIPSQVGACLVDEHHNPVNGDGLQETTGPTGAGGLLVWRKADNWTAYTDGYHTWINGPLGFQERLNTQLFPWESNPQPPPTSTPAPTYVASPMVCPPMQNDQVGVGGNIVYSRGAYVPVGSGVYGNVSIYGSDQIIMLSIQDSNGSVVWGSKAITGYGLFIFQPKYSDWFKIVVLNPSSSQTKTIMLNWRICTNP